MARVRISTTVDDELLERARALAGAGTDAELVDAAFRALLARQRLERVDEAYAVYDEHPLAEPDAWGDLASFHDASSSS